MESTRTDFEGIAVIGIGCRFPGGANSLDEYEEILRNGKNVWTEVPQSRFNWKAFYHQNPGIGGIGASNHRGGHFLSVDITKFDAAFFGISPAEAEAMDPQHRLQLETAYEALENAGIALSSVRGSPTGVYMAIFSKDYERMMYKDPNDLSKYHLPGVGEALLSNRVSYLFDLRGPSITLDTGCSGSLVALHQACQSLKSGEIDLALVGGSNLILGPDQMIPMTYIK